MSDRSKNPEGITGVDTITVKLSTYETALIVVALRHQAREVVFDVQTRYDLTALADRIEGAWG